MAYTLEVNYYNSYVGRRISANINEYQFDSNDRYFVPCWAGDIYGDYNINGLPNSLFTNQGEIVSPVPSAPKSISYTNQPSGLPAAGDPKWIIEESRIRGGYNNTSTDYGVKTHLVEENPQQNHRFNTIMFSGVYNSRTSYNKTNVFSIGEDITRSLDPHNGSIQKMYAEDTNLTVFQESKVSRALIDKDAIYSAEGGGTVTSSKLVIGQITPYVGEYGISKNPESFDFFGFRKYFVDKYRKDVLRLSKDGITEISQYGMSDYFRDELAKIDDGFLKKCVRYDGVTYNPTQFPVYPIDPFSLPLEIYIQFALSGGDLPNASEIPIGSQLYINGSPANSFVTQVNAGTGKVYLNSIPPEITTSDNIEFCIYDYDRVIGVYDTYKDNYILSLVKCKDATLLGNTNYQTVTFDESSLGWVSFYSYYPDHSRSLRNNLYSTKGSKLYIHYNDEVARNSFYNESPVDSSITFVFNPAVSLPKNFKTINYEGSNGWQVDVFDSDAEDTVGYIDQIKTVKSYNEGVYVDGGVEYRVGFNRYNNKYVANLRSNNETRPGQVIISPNGENVAGVKGFFATVKISTDSSTQVGGPKELFAVSSEFVPISR